MGQQAGIILAGFKSLFYAIKRLCWGAASKERGEISWHYHCQWPSFVAVGSAGAGASNPCAGAQSGCLQASHTRAVAVCPPQELGDGVTCPQSTQHCSHWAWTFSYLGWRNRCLFLLWRDYFFCATSLRLFAWLSLCFHHMQQALTTSYEAAIHLGPVWNIAGFSFSFFWTIHVANLSPCLHSFFSNVSGLLPCNISNPWLLDAADGVLVTLHHRSGCEDFLCLTSWLLRQGECSVESVWRTSVCLMPAGFSPDTLFH